jgi:hypothetical protein
MKARKKATAIRPAQLPREGWDEAFCLMAERGDDRLLDEPTPTVFDETEWACLTDLQFPRED